jgi:uncharacterized membrane protein YphA (DoxX/SURF4 family)
MAIMQTTQDRFHKFIFTGPDIMLTWLTRGLRIALGGIFIYASWDKILDPAAFAQIVANYQILPLYLVNPVAYTLPWLEAICGLALVIGYYTKGAVVIVNLLMLVFIGALLFNLARGLDINCGCFSVTQAHARGTLGTIIRDLFIMGLAAFIMTRLLRPQK